MSLARRAVRGAAITIVASTLARVIGLVGTLIVTRFISPDEYGEVSVTVVLTLTANQISTIGLGNYLVARPEDGRRAVFTMTAIHILLGSAALTILWFARAPFAALIHAPDAPKYLVGLIISVFVSRLGYIPERLLVRDLRFRHVALARAMGEFAYSATSVALAYKGYGGMAVVWGNVAKSAVRSGLCALFAERSWLVPRGLTMPSLFAMLRFGLPMWGAAMAAFVSRYWDNLFMSNMFGPSIVGAYNLAYNLADIPAVQVGEQIGDVLLPSFAHMPPERHASALERSTVLLALLVFPMAIGLGAIAPTLVHVFFNRKWAEVAPMLVLLSVLSVARPIGWTTDSYLQAKGRTRWSMALEVFKAITLLSLLRGLGHFGPLWSCVGVGIAFGAHALLGLRALASVGEISLGKFLARLTPPLFACVPIVGVVLGVRYGFRALGFDHPKLSLVVELVLGIAVYIPSALIIARTAAADLLQLVRGALRTGGGGST